MQNKLNYPTVICAKVHLGVSQLAGAASVVYGTQKSVQYPTATGGYASSTSFAQVLSDASFKEESTARAAALLRHADIPKQGVKTALIILEALLSRGGGSGCVEEDWCAVSALIEHAVEYLNRIAKEHNGNVAAGGVTFLSLCRPVQKFGREHSCERAASIVSYALKQPLLKLAATVGYDGYEVYERVNALAPNQFFSLNQIGIEQSIQTIPRYTDYIRVGLDTEDGTLKDLCTNERMTDAEELRASLLFVQRALCSILNIAATID